MPQLAPKYVGYVGMGFCDPFIKPTHSRLVEWLDGFADNESIHLLEGATLYKVPPDWDPRWTLLLVGGLVTDAINIDEAMVIWRWVIGHMDRGCSVIIVDSLLTAYAPPRPHECISFFNRMIHRTENPAKLRWIYIDEKVGDATGRSRAVPVVMKASTRMGGSQGDISHTKC